MSIVEPFEYQGFVLLPELATNRLIGASCDEIAFKVSGTCYSNHIVEFKKIVREVLMNKIISYEYAEKELNLLKTRLEENPAKFYRTHQVDNLIILAEDLLAASKKEQEVDFNMKEYYKQLDRLAALDHENNFQPLELHREIIEIYNLFSGVLKFSLDEVKQHYFERSNKE